MESFQFRSLSAAFRQLSTSFPRGENAGIFAVYARKDERVRTYLARSRALRCDIGVSTGLRDRKEPEICLPGRPGA